MRNLSPDMAAELEQPRLAPALLAELYFDSSTLYMWSGFGTLNWKGNDYLGGGNMIGISPIEETQELQAKGIVCTLNGIPSNLVSLALAERSRGRPFRLYLASVSSRSYVEVEDGDGLVELEDGSGYVRLENDLVDSPYRIFAGLMDVIEFTDNGETADLRLSVENILITGQRTKLSRYTAEQQKILYPNDQGLDFINQLQDKSIVW